MTNITSFSDFANLNEGEDKNRRRELRAQLKQQEAERLKPFIDAWIRSHDGRTENAALNRGW